VYVSGDNASLEVVRAGAYLTLTSQAAAEAAKLLGARAVVPLHFEG
jgi:L-ascorbate metabolism protein UlaG (beta-lactamase superfamily)